MRAATKLVPELKFDHEIYRQIFERLEKRRAGLFRNNHIDAFNVAMVSGLNKDFAGNEKRELSRIWRLMDNSQILFEEARIVSLSEAEKNPALAGHLVVPPEFGVFESVFDNLWPDPRARADAVGKAAAVERALVTAVEHVTNAQDPVQCKRLLLNCLWRHEQLLRDKKATDRAHAEVTGLPTVWTIPTMEEADSDSADKVGELLVMDLGELTGSVQSARLNTKAVQLTVEKGEEQKSFSVHHIVDRKGQQGLCDIVRYTDGIVVTLFRSTDALERFEEEAGALLGTYRFWADKSSIDFAGDTVVFDNDGLRYSLPVDKLKWWAGGTDQVDLKEIVRIPSDDVAFVKITTSMADVWYFQTKDEAVAVCGVGSKIGVSRWRTSYGS